MVLKTHWLKFFVLTYIVGGLSPLKPLVGVEDTDANGDTSCAPLWYSTTMQHLIDIYHKGKVHKLTSGNKKNDRTTVHSVVTAFKSCIEYIKGWQSLFFCFKWDWIKKIYASQMRIKVS